MHIVAAQLGHTSVRMLDKYYGHLVDDHIREAIAEVPSVGLNKAAQAASGNVIALPRKKSA
jgi:integrase